MSGIQTHGQIETVVTTGLISTATYSIGPEAKPPQFILPFTDTVFLYENSSQKKSSGTFLVEPLDVFDQRVGQSILYS